MAQIPFNKPSLTGSELSNIQVAYEAGMLSGDGAFSKSCERLLEHRVGCDRALLTHSCTAALEMMALLLELGPGDEVIMPSYTFVSTANAFAMRGATPVFVDVREDTLNIDESKIEQAITSKTKAICVVHYAGVACEMDRIERIARAHGLALLEDAAQAICATYLGRPLGSIGRFGAFSFHETKNATCGEGGALLINDSADAIAAEIMREKGTDRSQFLRGAVDKYTWRSIGSSFLLGELAAAFLKAQLDHVEAITRRRLELWDIYNRQLAPLEAAGYLKRPTVPAECGHNAHMFYILLADPGARAEVITRLEESGVNAVFHYVPLHSSEAGQRLGRAADGLEVTDRVANAILRLPLWTAMTNEDAVTVSEALSAALKHYA
ncbi:MAG: dTDP-4-amino-4,6-dideoxygalactose transaminase [Alphaproteobacteria bacterium]|nr:dTDP-4-amino-4,6-dideoxygalactose transaminase [Alphaproteobacteria bacterium]